MKIHSRNGFTLIEVLVVVAATGILMTLASVIFINTIRNSKKAEISSEARQNGALVVDRLQKDGRDAKSLGVNASGTILTITRTDDTTIIWECHAASSGNNAYITRSGVTITNRDPIDGVSHNECIFNPTNQPTLNLVNFKFTLTEGESVSTGPQEYQVQAPFITSITARNFL